MLLNNRFINTLLKYIDKLKWKVKGWFMQIDYKIAKDIDDPEMFHIVKIKPGEVTVLCNTTSKEFPIKIETPLDDIFSVIENDRKSIRDTLPKIMEVGDIKLNTDICGDCMSYFGKRKTSMKK